MLLALAAEETGGLLEQGDAIVETPGDDALAAVHRLTDIYLEELSGMFGRDMLREILVVGLVQTARSAPAWLISICVWSDN